MTSGKRSELAVAALLKRLFLRHNVTLNPRLVGRRGGNWKELCDIAAKTANNLLVVQTKGRAPERVSSTDVYGWQKWILKNAEDAYRQLVGTIRSLQSGNRVAIRGSDGVELDVSGVSNIYGCVVIDAPAFRHSGFRPYEVPADADHAPVIVLTAHDFNVATSLFCTPADFFEYLRWRYVNRRKVAMRGCAELDVMVAYLERRKDIDDVIADGIWAAIPPDYWQTFKETRLSKYAEHYSVTEDFACLLSALERCASSAKSVKVASESMREMDALRRDITDAMVGLSLSQRAAMCSHMRRHLYDASLQACYCACSFSGITSCNVIFVVSASSLEWRKDKLSTLARQAMKRWGWTKALGIALHPDWRKATHYMSFAGFSADCIGLNVIEDDTTLRWIWPNELMCQVSHSSIGLGGDECRKLYPAMHAMYWPSMDGENGVVTHIDFEAKVCYRRSHYKGPVRPAPERIAED